VSMEPERLPLAHYRELVVKRGRREMQVGDVSVDPGWHVAADLLPVIDRLAARVLVLEEALRERPITPPLSAEAAEVDDWFEAYVVWYDRCGAALAAEEPA
jgi:hypothetical protein